MVPVFVGEAHPCIENILAIVFMVLTLLVEFANDFFTDRPIVFG